MSKVSIIVPVYKTANTLSRCIESIQQQDYADFELILIDDGSPDRSGEICDEYAEKDQRIKVIHKPNGGVSSARNAGLDAATGEYIVFVDSDDYVTETYLSDLLVDGYDFVIAGYIEENVDGVRRRVVRASADVREISFNPEDQYKVLSSGYTIYGSWSKLYKRSIIEKNNIKFDINNCMGEDTMFSSDYLVHCKSFRIIEQTPYIYVRYGNSTTLSTTISKRFLISYEQTEKRVYDNFISFLGYADDYTEAVKRRLVFYFLIMLADKEASIKRKFEIYDYLYSNDLFVEALEQREFDFQGISNRLFNALKIKNPVITCLMSTIITIRSRIKERYNSV